MTVLTCLRSVETNKDKDKCFIINRAPTDTCVYKTTIMQGAEKMYQALLSSPATSNCLEATGREIRGSDSQADC